MSPSSLLGTAMRAITLVTELFPFRTRHQCIAAFMTGSDLDELLLFFFPLASPLAPRRTETTRRRKLAGVSLLTLFFSPPSTPYYVSTY